MLAEEVDKNYYDLDDIIACSSNVLCSFNGNISKDVFGLLGRKAPDMVVDKTFKTEIPLFMAQALHRTCSIELPKAFNTLTQQALKANAKSVSLESLNQHFYCFGTHLALTIAGIN
ncbi:DNA replication complex GINS protein PSF3 [Toxocara canis]|uniref:DNA replication complex GINS protein PSF3 n=1 Tax=Toxocara canis TaxID=6265 RepID=A0A0B2W206_TOXCA|nr:DNA replication complex GINS protein PSF3 [Toxocara canis]